MPKIMFLEDYERLLKAGNSCGEPGPLLLMPACHPYSDVRAIYEKGYIVLKCATCGQRFSRIPVALEDGNDA